MVLLDVLDMSIGKLFDMGSLPEPFNGKDINGWARYSILVRLPEILERMIHDNQFDDEKVSQLYRLVEKIRRGTIEPILDSQAPDYMNWRMYCKPYLGKSWLEVPWFFAEHYFYRKILEILGYFSHRVYQDPFLQEKRRGYEASQSKILQLIRYTFDTLEHSEREEVLGKLLALNLWGNQSDLSLFPAKDGDLIDTEFHINLHDEKIIHDHRKQIVNWWQSNPVKTADIILDNAGYELIADLVLAYYLLKSELVERVFLHVKAHPTFVSDATMTDVIDALSYLSRYKDSIVVKFAQEMMSFIGYNIFVLDSFYWNSPLVGWEIPKTLAEHFAASDLVINKGDANYRRWLGDLMWPSEAALSQILNYFPAPIILLRTLKSELITDLDPSSIREYERQDDKWMVDGKWGIIQFVPKSEP